MNWHEVPLIFDCEGSRLIGIITQPGHPIETGVVIVVGGPQYRAGSHRQFTLLARQLAEQRIASIRFDYRGMGDSEGDMRNFENIDLDIRTAINNLMAQVPQIKQIVLWGLCDAASAALFYGHTDPRVKGMILLNPWVHTEAGAARARLKHYYLSRLLSKGFWTKLFSGKLRIGETIGDLSKSTQQASADNAGYLKPTNDPRHGSPGYIERMLNGMRCFQGNIKIILSGIDLVAQEFIDLTHRDKIWQKVFNSGKVQNLHIAAANHTFSSCAWRAQVHESSCQWIKEKTAHRGHQ